jgi:hypothetical protein
MPWDSACFTYAVRSPRPIPSDLFLSKHLATFVVELLSSTPPFSKTDLLAIRAFHRTATSCHNELSVPIWD